MTARNRIEEIKRQGYDIDFGEVFNKTIEVYKKIAANAGIVFILFILVMGALVMGIMGAFWGFSTVTETMTSFNIQNLSAVMVISYVFFIALVGGLVSPFTAGIIKMAYCADNRLEFSIGTAFDYYKGPYFKELFVSTILIGLAGAGISTILESMGVVFVGSLITYIISFFTFLTIPLIIFGDIKAVEAIQGSCIIVSKNIFVLFGLLLVGLVIVMIGLVGFCIGVFFTAPFIYAMYYCIYQDIVGTEYKDELDEIGSHAE